ncbi:GTP cyclohydrolase I FolE [Spongiactinospora gelatinilytica]|uniref:GTP cyclohydrolase 1 n=1 Tax=Spongiactinospora gelatinilytica TaxID=2666298 RepID=A0A2W2HFT6_9ACTN|nr:GTP cyclohydrolase I [Spongiactinospora gelatinilytica]PZG45047.1 GTP cyclohydrolase I FolE [Spongiactinospora gelatinilytica]
MTMDEARIQALYRELLIAIGEDPDREGLRDTPRRAAAFWRDFLTYRPGRIDTTFRHEPAGEQFVQVSEISTWSLCEHHLLPIHLLVNIAYLPAGAVLGLSKLVRVTELAARRLQIQERFVEQVADELQKITGSDDVAVVAAGHHLCMSMRGTRAQGARTLTRTLRGRFLQDPRLVSALGAGP